MKLVTVKGMIVSTIEVTTNTYNIYKILKSANKVFGEIKRKISFIYQ